MKTCSIIDSLRDTFSIPEDDPLIIAGPCAVENRVMFEETAAVLKECGVRLMRAAIFKPRTSPLSFQGIGEDGLDLIRETSRKYNLGMVSEAMEISHVGVLEKTVDMVQIGTRNMHNYSLLKALGNQSKPVLLKRGFMADSKEFFLAAEYIRQGGNTNILLCERGIRTFESATRNTLDLNLVPITHISTDLPIIVDPSHGTGRSDIVIPMARAAIAAGADGLMVEVHPNPAKALSDGLQSLDFSSFTRLMHEVREMWRAVHSSVLYSDR